ncbi:hypothetical protein NT6N_15360 [Oceaniferula spumae]|uniref:Ice-binding protein C-terminal domain-containing protein n=1 Tax=Oceaniferula spumae TaxID=2979115 RepID=A0AAT9FKM7_9BACT
MKVNSKLRLLGSIVLASTMMSATSQAVVLVMWSQVGNDVVASYSGEMGLNADSNAPLFTQTEVAPNYFNNQGGSIGFNQTETFMATDFTGIITGTFIADLTSGDRFGHFGTSFYVGPAGYTATTEVTGSMTFENQTLAGMGVDGFAAPTVAFSFDNQGVEEALILYQTDNVPEPSSTALLGLAGLVLIIRRRR